VLQLALFMVGYNDKGRSPEEITILAKQDAAFQQKH
jgi:hypothetical protein